MATASFSARTIDARRSTLNHGKQNEPRGDGRVSVDHVRFICRFVSKSIDKILLAVQCLSWSCFNVFISLHVDENNNNRKMSLNVLRDRIRSFAWERMKSSSPHTSIDSGWCFLSVRSMWLFFCSFALFPYLIAPTRRFNVGSNCDVLLCLFFCLFGFFLLLSRGRDDRRANWSAQTWVMHSQLCTRVCVFVCLCGKAAKYRFLFELQRRHSPPTSTDACTNLNDPGPLLCRYQSCVLSTCRWLAKRNVIVLFICFLFLDRKIWKTLRL